MDEVLQGGQPIQIETALPAPKETQKLTADYRSLGLTLGRHPTALLRARFDRERVIRSDRLRQVRDGASVTVAGIVTHRQRPGTASGVVFATLEDEAGITNLIIWSRVLDEQREVILGSQLMLVKGDPPARRGLCAAWSARDHSHRQRKGIHRPGDADLVASARNRPAPD